MYNNNNLPVMELVRRPPTSPASIVLRHGPRRFQSRGLELATIFAEIDRCRRRPRPTIQRLSTTAESTRPHLFELHVEQRRATAQQSGARLVGLYDARPRA